ncbi:hypothetical protein PybrP1_003126 [[Pythium] brassicae (nom. inval.)]|nr:hypothetical protein PybrP1_003126 [[Pythium] brassicae (nom. inval.)]
MTRNNNNNYDDDDDDLLMALQSMEPCGNCGADGAKIPCMSGCGEVYYCSRECNMHHASAHRLRCRNLRCSKFNDSESESGSDDYEEFTDDSDAEYETDSGGDDDEEEEEEVKPKAGKGGKKGAAKTGKAGGKGGGKKKSRTNSSREDGEGGARRKLSVDSDIEKRIEEKILRRLKKQEEQRIAVAIEQRMREEKASWRDDEMNRIIMEMRERFQIEMSNGQFMALAGAPAVPGNPQAEEKMPAGTEAGGGAGADSSSSAAGDVSKEALDAAALRNRSASKESSWNNACVAFEALRVVVWKHSFLPRIKFERSADTGVFHAIAQLDPDESFRHIELGDRLESVNGRAIDESVVAEEDLDDVFAAFASPLVLKFTAARPDSGKVHDYTVTWSNGPLGVTLKDDCVNQKVPIVNRLTKKVGSVAVKQNITIGDVLVAINNIDTIQLGCSLSMSILKKVQLPAKLRFRGVGGPPPGAENDDDDDDDDAGGAAASSGLGKQSDVMTRESSLSLSMSRPANYTVNWGEGPLGLTIIPGLNETDLPVIKKVTGTGTSEGIEKTQVGDVLESMNGISTVNMHFEKVVSYLKSAPKPVLLRFKSSMADMAGASDVTVQRALPPPPVNVASQPPLISRGSLDSATLNSHRAGSSNDLSRTMPLPSSAAAMPSDTYKVVWGAGPLGLTIDAIPNASGAFIKRISSQGAAAQLSQDCTGDELTHINDMDVTRIVFQDIVAHLKNVPRPVTLFFRRRGTVADKSRAQAQAQARISDTPAMGRRPSARDEAGGVHYYNLVWQANTPLGLSLRGADGGCEYPYITRVTGSGSSAHLPDTVVNDCLISIDGRSVHMRDKTFDEVMGMLKSMQKPLTLKFQSRGGTMPRPGSSTNLHAAVPGYAAGGGAGAPPPQQQWRQQQAPPPPQFSQSHNGAAASRSGPPPPYAPSSSSVPTPDDRLAASGLRPNNSLSRSFLGASDRALDAAAGNEEKFSNIHSPFLVQNKLSTGRRQKMLKGLKK